MIFFCLIAKIALAIKNDLFRLLRIVLPLFYLTTITLFKFDDKVYIFLTIALIIYVYFFGFRKLNNFLSVNFLTGKIVVNYYTSTRKISLNYLKDSYLKAFRKLTEKKFIFKNYKKECYIISNAALKYYLTHQNSIKYEVIFIEKGIAWERFLRYSILDIIKMNKDQCKNLFKKKNRYLFYIHLDSR